MAEAHNGYEAGHWLWFATASLAVPRMATFSMTAGAGSTIGQVVEASLWRPRLRRIQHLGGPQMGLWTGLHQDCRDVTPWLEAIGNCTERPMHQRPVCLITSTPQSFSMFQSLERIFGPRSTSCVLSTSITDSGYYTGLCQLLLGLQLFR